MPSLWLEPRWFENIEVELKRHATPEEVVPDNETFRSGRSSQQEFSRSHFPVAVGQNFFSLIARLLDEEVSLLISMGVVGQLESVIDVAQKTLEFRNIHNAKVPLEVVAGHLTDDLAASTTDSIPRFHPETTTTTDAAINQQASTQTNKRNRPNNIDCDKLEIQECSA